jgi:hypothetical protein
MVAFQRVPENRMAVFSKVAGAMLVNFQQIIGGSEINIALYTVFFLRKIAICALRAKSLHKVCIA